MSQLGAARKLSSMPILELGVRTLSSSPMGLRMPQFDRQPVMAIRRETINVWERRAPLAPHHVRKLVRNGVKVIVQPSDRRAYSMQVSFKLF